ncbi:MULTISPECIES: hypothetical protein [unclassified Beijerinckia]|uniref:hypothetical protein n=1 Tax=unclassified Beijerinckia TaxID=2638183 RepID=UPI00089AADB7|nr:MULTISPECIES: hypothetical protein [unclassified Beijerinckia]MDH7794212.1 hypothetical protein [Beijerinckia sp. GAS462]SEB55921.1 hypothetical protein SAMN05443249_0478 [Beijerinckia sp. 28-YEA-48]
MRTSSTMATAMGVIVLALSGAVGAKSAPAAPMAAPRPAPALLPRIGPAPALHVQPAHRPPSMQGQFRPPMGGPHRPWPGRRFVYGAPFPAYGVYPSGLAEPPLEMSSEPPLDAGLQYGGYYKVPTLCVPPTIIIIGSGMKGAITPPVARAGGCTAPQVVYQKRADMRPQAIEREPRRGKKRAR